MIKQAPHLIPSIYLANYLNEFEDIIRKYDVHEKKMGKGEYLTRYSNVKCSRNVSTADCFAKGNSI